MNFDKIIEKQIILDEAIKKAHSINVDNYDKMLIALYTEIGEFANEVQSFKYWKKTKQIDRLKMLEEFADGLHFLISFAIKYNVSKIIEPLVLSNDINLQILAMFQATSKLVKKINKRNIEKAIAIYIGIARLLSISDEEINEAYFLKNIINFERIKSNY